jgi:hypothetical protein
MDGMSTGSILFLSAVNFFRPGGTLLAGDIAVPSASRAFDYLQPPGGTNLARDIDVPSVRNRRFSCKLRSEPPDVPDLSRHRKIGKKRDVLVLLNSPFVIRKTDGQLINRVTDFQFCRWDFEISTSIARILADF